MTRTLTPSRQSPRGLVPLLLLAAWLSGCGSPAPTPKSGSPPPRSPARTAIPASAWSTEADRWLGTPYRTGGNDRRGIDCSGFAQQVHLKVAGIRLPRTTSDQFRTGRPVARTDLRPGDLVFFDTLGRGVSHVGVMVGGDRFAHASSSRGVMYSRLAEDYWNRRYLGGRRVP